jgi:NTP pyrophosphatase (non-canonical NTP hydrolase)
MSTNKIMDVEHARNQEYVHRVNVEKGWFDKPVSFLEAMALLVTEITEADDSVEAEGLIGGREARHHTRSELADVYIRLVDDASRFSLNLGVIVDVYQFSYEPLPFRTFHDATRRLVKRVVDIIEAYRVEGLDDERKPGLETTRAFAYFYLQLRDTCDYFKVDLMQAFNDKMAVNEKREYRHGGKHA